MICHQRKFIFIHIPKTAGSSIKEVLGVGWQNHKDLARYRRELAPELYESYYKFTVVRNPWERLLSDYNFQRTKGGRRHGRLFLYNEKGRKRGFGDWVRKVFDDPYAYEARVWGGSVSPSIHRWSPQVDWIEVDGSRQVDFVARIESLREDFSRLCGRLELSPARLPMRQKKFHWHYSHYYDEATRDLVGAYYARDIEAFGYTFETGVKPAWWQRMVLASFAK